MRNDAKTLQFLTQGELKALLEKAKRTSARDYAMILLGYRHGLRCSSLCNTSVQNVDLAAGNIRCERSKGSISNWQQMGRDEIKAVKAWLRKRPKTDSPYLFISRKGSPVSRSQFFRIFKKLGMSIGLPEKKCHPHVLKHSLGTHLANAGVPVQVIQQRLGHSNISNTMVYLQISNVFVDRAVEAAVMNGAVV
jgi:type 1 fimbriae regulatory protein FimB